MTLDQYSVNVVLVVTNEEEKRIATASPPNGLQKYLPPSHTPPGLIPPTTREGRAIGVRNGFGPLPGLC